MRRLEPVMTKKKALFYLIVLIFAVGLTTVWKKYYFADPAQYFPDACKMVISPSCNEYIINATKEKKYTEAVKIQKVRLSENEKILKFYKRKMRNKCLIEMTADEATESFKSCSIPANKNKDFFLLSASNFTIQDIITDTISVSRIEKNELKDNNAALFTLKQGEKMLLKNKFYPNREVSLKFIQQEIESVTIKK